MKEKSTLNLSTVIYFTVIGVFIVLQYLNGGIVPELTFLIFMITTIPFLLFTKKFYLAMPVIAVFMLMLTVATLPNSVYLVTGEEPAFVMTSSILGFLLTLLIGNQVTHAEWSIKSPWVANLLGLFGLYISEFMLLIYLDKPSQILIGIVGFLTFILISISYLTIGKYVSIHAPNEMSGDRVSDSLKDAIMSKTYLHVESKSRKRKQLTVLVSKSKSKNSYRIFFTNNEIYYDKDVPFKRQFKIIKDKKERFIYSWLLRESTISKESKKTDKIKNEMFVVISIDDKYTEGKIEIFDIKVPRSSKVNRVGHLTISGNDKKIFMNKFNELIVELSLSENGYV